MLKTMNYVVFSYFSRVEVKKQKCIGNFKSVDKCRFFLKFHQGGN